MSIEKRLKALESYQKIAEDQETIFINDSGLKVTGYTLCHAAAGGELVERLPGELLEDLQDRCRDLDRDHRRENPLQQTQASSIAFAEYDLKKGIEL